MFKCRSFQFLKNKKTGIGQFRWSAWALFRRRKSSKNSDSGTTGDSFLPAQACLNFILQSGLQKSLETRALFLFLKKGAIWNLEKLVIQHWPQLCRSEEKFHMGHSSLFSANQIYPKMILIRNKLNFRSNRS